MGKPDDIAWGVVYLAWEESTFMTGSARVIDGGYTAIESLGDGSWRRAS